MSKRQRREPSSFTFLSMTPEFHEFEQAPFPGRKRIIAELRGCSTRDPDELWELGYKWYNEWLKVLGSDAAISLPFVSNKTIKGIKAQIANLIYECAFLTEDRSLYHGLLNNRDLASVVWQRWYKSEIRAHNFQMKPHVKGSKLTFAPVVRQYNRLHRQWLTFARVCKSWEFQVSRSPEVEAMFAAVPYATELQVAYFPGTSKWRFLVMLFEHAKYISHHMRRTDTYKPFIIT